MTKSICFDYIKSPVFAGLFCLLLLAGCRTAYSPDQVSQLFWQAMTDKDLATARQLATKDSQNIITEDSGLPLEQLSLQIGETTINGEHASVVTHVDSETLAQYRKFRFNTLLIKQDNQWKVDYRSTLRQMPLRSLQQLIDNLKNFSEKLGQQLEQQLPFVEQFLQDLTEELDRQLDQFNRRFDKNKPEKNQNPYKNSI